jgi:hypothetical protein
MPADLSDDETSHPLKADGRNFYKVEKWIKDGSKVDRMLYAAAAWTRRGRLSPRRSTIGRVSG